MKTRSAPRTLQAFASPLAVAFGVALTLTIQGYQYGKSNHTVYLIDALRQTSPNLLQNDWFVTQTLQYHAAFGLLTRALMKLGIIEPVFLMGYVMLAILLHAAWWRIVKALGGGVDVFLLSEVLFHVSAAGTALGMYQFLQDGAFLPSNIASVAFLWGVFLWISGRRAWSAVLFGISGLFHLNYAIVAPAVWIALAATSWIKERQRVTTLEWFGAIAMAELCLMNLAPAVLVISRRRGRMPLQEFIDIYVHLRHPHHYAPLAWPLWLWLSFLWPLPLAWRYWRRRRDDDDQANAQAARIVTFILLFLVIAFIGAGVFFVSETLVQLSLWRFSVFAKLLTCIAAALWIMSRAQRPRLATAASALIGCAMIAACVARGPYFGAFHIVVDDEPYLAACDWIRAHTPEDAIFLVPPHEQEFRLRAQRAIVVNYKCVPQLSAELPAWRERLSAVLDVPDLRTLPTPFPATLAAMQDRFDALPPEHLVAVARRYGARYLLLHQRLPMTQVADRLDMDGNDSWFLYDLESQAGKSGN